jgi:hypothetical protein
MHKKLAAELVSLANSILELKSNDINTLHQNAKDLYEKLTVLKFVENNLAEAPVDEDEGKQVANAETVVENKGEVEPQIEEKDEEVIEEKVVEEKKVSLELSVEKQEIETEEPLDTFFSLEENELKKDAEDIATQFTLESELEDAISADEATAFFEKATKESSVIEEKAAAQKRSLNDALFKGNIQVGLNDRIAFVKHLFDGSQEDFNRVLSQLNSFNSEKEAKNFVNKMVKPDYNWDEKEEYETRLLNLIERKFM